jgi:hypothetical protein
MEMHRLHDELADAIENDKWKMAKNRARGILKLLPVALDPATSRTGTPHLDGVYNIGSQHIVDAPDDARVVIQKMSDTIALAKSKLRRKKKKRKRK